MKHLFIIFSFLVVLLMSACSDSESESMAVPDNPPCTGDNCSDTIDDDNTTDEKPNSENEDLITTLKKLGLNKYIGAASYVQGVTNDLGWTTIHFDIDDCKCIYETEYYVKVRQGDPRKVILYLKDGGATWPELQGLSNTTASFADPTDDPDSEMLWFSTDNKNPLHDWSVVYLPYCDGSVFSGDNDADYDEDGTSDHFHWGLKNLSGGVTVMKDFFPDAEKVLLSGSSAGAFGTIIAPGVARIEYPLAKIYILNDSGPGIIDPDNTTMMQDLKDTWKFEHLIPKDCHKCQDQLIYLFEWYLNNDPQLRIGLFSSYKDLVIADVFTKMKGNDYKTVLKEVTDDLHSANPDRFKRFFINGRCHTMYNKLSFEIIPFPIPLIGCGMNNEIDGVSQYDWIAQLTEEVDEEWLDLIE